MSQDKNFWQKLNKSKHLPAKRSVSHNHETFWKVLGKQCKKEKRPVLALAPMAGYTDLAFRQLCRELGADVVYTEMISADALYYNSKKTLAMLKTTKKEQPCVCQLFGKHPEHFAKAAQIVEKAGFAGIDINFGCPAAKVVRHGGGISLLNDLDLCHKIIANTSNAVKIPVSVKTRVSIINKKTGKKITALDFIKKIKDLKVAALMLHGRSYEQGFRGGIDDIDFTSIKKAVETFNGIVLANGAVKTPTDAEKLWRLTSADGIGIGQGVFGHPWIFDDIKNHAELIRNLNTRNIAEQKIRSKSWSEIKKIALKHARLAYKYKGEHGIVETRKHLAWYVNGLPDASELRGQLVRATTISEIKEILG